MEALDAGPKNKNPSQQNPETLYPKHYLLFLEGYGLRCVLPGKLSANSTKPKKQVLEKNSSGNY